MLKYIQAGYQNIYIIRFSVWASENRWCPIIDHLLYYGESSVLIDTPIHIYTYVHVVTMHKHKTIIMTVLTASVQQITVLPM